MPFMVTLYFYITLEHIYVPSLVFVTQKRKKRRTKTSNNQVKPFRRGKMMANNKFSATH